MSKVESCEGAATEVVSTGTTVRDCEGLIATPGAIDAKASLEPLRMHSPLVVAYERTSSGGSEELLTHEERGSEKGSDDT